MTCWDDSVMLNFTSRQRQAKCSLSVFGTAMTSGSKTHAILNVFFNSEVRKSIVEEDPIGTLDVEVFSGRSVEF